MRSSCRNCDAPLGELGQASVVACARCGAIEYTKSDIDEFAVAIVEGRTDPPRTSSITGSGVRVRFEPAAMAEAANECTARSRGNLTIVAPRWSAWSAILLLVLATVLGCLGYNLMLALRSNCYFPLALAAIPGLIYVIIRLAIEFDRMRISVVNGRLIVKPCARLPGVFLVPSDKVLRLFVARLEGAYALFVRTEGDPQPRLALRRIRRPELGWYLARQVEHALGITDRPAPEDVDDVQPPTPRSWVARLGVRLWELCFLLVAVGAPTVTLWGYGAELAALNVQDDPQETTIEARQAGPVYFTADVEFAEYEWGILRDVPRSVAIRIQVLQGGKPVQDLRCDPFDTTVWWDHFSNKEGKKRGAYISFWGAMNGCDFALPAAGPYRLRAWHQRNPDMQHVGLAETTITMRQGTAMNAIGLRRMRDAYVMGWLLLLFAPIAFVLVAKPWQKLVKRG